MSKEILDFGFGVLVGSVVSGAIFLYLYFKFSKKEQLIKDKLKEFYYENKLLKSRLEDLKNIKEEFKKISSLLLEENSNFLIQNSTKNINLLLNPFKESIDEFKNSIKNYYVNEAKERFFLVKELQNLNSLNSKLADESNRLTNALKGDNKFQGSWGEFILESVLERSGLRRGFEYETQSSFKSGDKLYRPDVVVKLPKNRVIFIDSKVSLKDYDIFVNDKDKEALKRHINSIKNHIKNLSSKSYEKLEEVESIELVLMFIPIESAFIEALREDRELFDFAYSKNIILVSPTTLLTVLKTVEYSWQKYYQDKNTKEIVKKASLLYDKFQGFLNDLKTVDSSLKKAQNSYDEAFKKLSTGKGNILKTTDDLRSLIHLSNNSSDTITSKKL